ncbi:MAG: AAA family ATPase [Pseudomonadota bacterium]
MNAPLLICFSGQPGVGKTAVARALAQRTGYVFLRIDSIECALRNVEGSVFAGPEGYIAGAAVASDHLMLGRAVVADAVNEDHRGQNVWRHLAAETGAQLFPVNVTCSDAQEHRRRVEQRRPDLPGHQLPDWQAVQARIIQPWAVPALQIDTAHRTTEAMAARIETALHQGLRKGGATFFPSN